MPVAEKNSKAELCVQYNCSAKTVARWIKILVDNHKTLAKDRDDKSYLAWEDYNKFSKVLTPLQLQNFKSHFGEP